MQIGDLVTITEKHLEYYTGNKCFKNGLVGTIKHLTWFKAIVDCAGTLFLVDRRELELV